MSKIWEKEYEQTRSTKREEYKYVLQRSGRMIRLIPNPSEELKLIAVRQDASAIEFIINPTKEMQKIAVQIDGHLIRYLKSPSEDIQILAVKQSPVALVRIKSPSIRVQKAAIETDPAVYNLLRNPSSEMIAWMKSEGINPVPVKDMYGNHKYALLK